MFGKDSKVGKEVSRVLQKEARKDKHGMMPIYEEKGVYNFYLRMGSGGSIAPLEESTVVPESKDFDAKEVLKSIEKDTLLQREIVELIARRRSSGGGRPPNGM